MNDSQAPTTCLAHVCFCPVRTVNRAMRSEHNVLPHNVLLQMTVEMILCSGSFMSDFYKCENYSKFIVDQCLHSQSDITA